MSLQSYTLNPNAKPDTAWYHGKIQIVLAQILVACEKYEEAEKVTNQAIEFLTAIRGPENSKTIKVMHNLAYLRILQGKYAEGEEILRKVLVILMESHGVEEPFTLAAMQNLAIALQCQGRFEEGESLAREVVFFRKKVLGLEHEGTLFSMGCLADLLYNFRKCAEGKSVAEECLEMCIAVLGTAHWLTIRAKARVDDIDSVMDYEVDTSDSRNSDALREDLKWNEHGRVVWEDQKRSGRETSIQEIIGALKLSD